MIEIAKEKNVYYEIDELYLGKPETYPEKFKNRFDVITNSAAITHGHCSAEVFEEMLLSLKSNGLMIFSTRADYIAEFCQSKMDELSEQGKWELVSKDDFIRFQEFTVGMGRFTPTLSHMFVYKALK